jgi:peptidoglycan glycosyltransferase
LLNRATQGRYPPGSVIKTLTAAAALDSGVLPDPSAAVTCPNLLPTEAGAPPVRNAVDNLFRRTGDPSDLVRVFAFSCNTAFAQIGLVLGADRFLEYARRFGLQTTDTRSGTPDLRDIPAEIGTIANEAAFLQRPAALADTAFGQGQALVTPLDMAQLAASIANEGRLMRPYLVAEARTGDRVVYRRWCARSFRRKPHSVCLRSCARRLKSATRSRLRYQALPLARRPALPKHRAACRTPGSWRLRR